MPKRPILSICIPTYNRAVFLESTLNQLKLETINLEDKIELCISDNGSTDNTQEIIKKFILENPKIKVKTNIFDKNIGFTLNFKKILEMASGKYTFTIGDDDDFIPGRLSLLISYLTKEGDVSYLACNAIRADKSNILNFSDVLDSNTPGFICYEGIEKNKEVIRHVLLASTGIFVNVYNTDLIKQFPFPFGRYGSYEQTYFALKSILNSKKFCVMKRPVVLYQGFGDLFDLDIYLVRFGKGLQLNDDLNRDFCIPHNLKSCDLKLDLRNFFVLSAIFNDDKDEAKKRKFIDVLQKLKSVQLRQNPFSFLSFFCYIICFLFQFYSIRKFIAIFYYSYCRLFKKKTFIQKNRERVHARPSE
ncbi:MAG TPA: glycosyltransferase family 2 protein [Candidatus Bilamarchaeaceae archaeon]|nr:glycosyltransferase family 2 protein [Candidatus Bilamarchaeaceae archaeon]